MKTDIISSAGAAILGIVIAYFACNLLIGDLTDYTVKTIDNEVDATLADPDNDVFNYKAVNPTVEVYVGQCKEYSEQGECIDDSASAIEDGTIDNTSGDQSSTNTEKNDDNIDIQGE